MIVDFSLVLVVLALVSGVIWAVDHWYLAGLEQPRGLGAAALRRQAAKLPEVADAPCFVDVATAMKQAFAKAVEGDRVVVCGSFHTVADAMACRV